jgi:ACT domain-containing protein
VELKQAKEILKNALNVAVQKGCFSIEDVAVIIEALKKIETIQDVEFIANETIHPLT